MANIDQEFVEFVVKSLVNEPDAVKIERSIDEKGVLLELTVAADDLGRVIGKRGNTAQSIRTLLRALGTKNDARYNLKIVDVNSGDRPPRDNRDDNRQQQDDSNVTNDAAAVAAVATTTDDTSASSGASQWAHLSSSSDDDDTSTSDDDNAQKTDENKENSVVEKTRQELADLDDLDI